MPAVKKSIPINLPARLSTRARGRVSWKPTKEQMETAYQMWKAGKTDQEISDEFCISFITYYRNRVLFKRYYRRKEYVLNKQAIGRPAGSQLDNHPLLKAQVLRAFAIAGYSMNQVSKLIGCSVSTLSTWLMRHPSMKDIFTYASDYADMQVTSALKRRACGFKVKKKQFATYQGAITDNVDYEEEVPPDTNAATIWLVNRRGWKRDNESSRMDNKGKILETLDKITEIDEEECKKYDSEMEGK